MLAGILFCQFVVAPVPAQAISFNFLSKAGQEIPKVMGWSAEKAAGSNPAGLMAHLVDGQGNKFFALFASTPKPELKKFVSQFGNSAMAFSKTGALLTVETLKRFPMEAFTFFLAIGTLNVQHLIFNYGDNPVLLQQHIESQKDPYSQLGFAAFMLANSWATAPLQAMLEPGSKLTPFIPYMGMTVGMMASNIVGELAHFSETKKCVADLNARITEAKKYESCQKAFDSMTDYSIEKLHEWAPGLMSMVASQVAAVYIEKFVVSKVLVFLGVEALMLAVPGRTAGKVVRFGFKWLGKIGQIGLFMGLDQLMHSWFAVPYNDIKDSNRLNDQEEHLLGLLYEKKKNGWNPSTEKNSGEDLDLTIHRMTDMIRSWRESNMSDITMSVATWTQFMSQFTAIYRSSKLFYTNVVNQLHEKAYRNRPGFPQYIDRVMPLNGVKPLDLKDEEQTSDLFTGPAEYFRHQRLKVAEVSQQLKQALAAISTNTKGFSEADIKFLNQITLLMNSNDDSKIGEAMDLINKELRLRVMYPGLFPAPPTPPLDYLSSNYGPDSKLNTFEGLQRILVQVRNALGAPVPLWNAGAGYLAAYQADPEKAPVLDQITSTPSSINGIMTMKPVQYFIGSMVAGPEVSKHEPLITFTAGFPAKFFPPKIATIDDFKLNRNELKDWNIGAGPTIFNIPVYLRRGQTLTKIDNLFEVIRQGQIKPEVLGTSDKVGLDEWWTQNIETEYIKSWEAFEQKYQKNAVALIKRVFKTEDRFTNSSSLSNGIALSLKQERKLYLMILGEMLSDLSTTQKNASLSMGQSPVSESRMRGSLQKELRPYSAVQVYSENLDGAVKIPLLKSLIQTNQLSLSAALSPYLGQQTIRINGLFSPVSTLTKNLKFQDDLMNKFEDLEGLLRKFKVAAVSKSTLQLPPELGNTSIDLEDEVISSDVKNSDLEASYKNIEDALKAFEQILGIEQAKASSDVFKNTPSDTDKGSDVVTKLDLNLSVFQKRIGSLLINGLRNNAAELKNIGSMMNTVSYRRAEAENKTGFDTSCVNIATGIRKDLSGKDLALERCKKAVSK